MKAKNWATCCDKIKKCHLAGQMMYCFGSKQIIMSRNTQRRMKYLYSTSPVHKYFNHDLNKQNVIHKLPMTEFFLLFQVL